MVNNRILPFLILTFLWSWTWWILGLDLLKDGINQETISEFLFYFFAGVYGPSISALLTSFYLDGYNGTINLLKKLFIWNVPLKIYALIVILPILFVLSAIGLYYLFFGRIGPFEIMAFVSIPTVLWAGLYAGPLGEELGWRGFLLPELQRKNSKLRSAIYIGILWFVWHIPLFWAPFGTLVSGGRITLLPLVTYLTMIICLSIIITWLVNNSKGSVLIAILFHLSTNAGIALLFFPELSLKFKEIHLLSGVTILLFTVWLLAKNKLNKSEI